jgi:diguanylate cyclase
MPAAPPTEHEKQRLATLAAQHLLDTPPDARFDSLVRLTADLFDVPIALVSLVDRDRQWFKSAVGLSACETHRDYAFCAYAILQPDDVMVIEDAAADPRFADNPLVTGDPFIRFYAGAPLLARDGQPLGTLCIIDCKPRALAPSMRVRLRELADSAATMINLHRCTFDSQHAATHDRLTGLANRFQFENRLESAVSDALSGRPCALLLCDVDELKDINDKLGHDVGDELLVAMARRFQNIVRGTDLVARIGGDEFAVLVNGPVDLAAMAAISRRIVEYMRVPFRVGGRQVVSSISIGAVLCPLDAIDARSLLRMADQALYDAKRGGRARTVSADRHSAQSEQNSSVVSGRAMEAALRLAMTRGELTLHWQPIFEMATLTVCAFEGLLRWAHPEQGPIAPSLFLPLAEASGLIAYLDCWVLRTACRTAATWPDRFGIAVNLSAHWFEGGVVERVEHALRESNLDPHRLEIELTERTMISSRDMARTQMIALRAMGVRMSLDDFGTGYSSLAYMRQYPFDTVKLDRAFVAAIGDDARADAVARAIIQLGHGLDMQVCAEGVETPLQLAFLRAEKCDLAQGFLLGHPEASPHTDAFSLRSLGLAVPIANRLRPTVPSPSLGFDPVLARSNNGAEEITGARTAAKP